MRELCQVVRGNNVYGFKPITGPMSYADCVQYLREHSDEILDPDYEYEYGLDIIYVESGRLASWVL